MATSEQITSAGPPSEGKEASGPGDAAGRRRSSFSRKPDADVESAGPGIGALDVWALGITIVTGSNHRHILLTT